MSQCSNDMPLFGIRLTGPMDQEHSNNSHQEIRLDQAYTDQGFCCMKPNGPIPIIQPIVVVVVALPSATKVKIVPEPRVGVSET